MKKYNLIKLVFFILLIVSVFFNMYFSYLISSHSKNDQDDTYSENLINFNQISNLIIKEFAINDYKEILHENNHMLALPLQSKDKDLLSRQKLFIFKNKEKETVIMLNISASKYNLSSNNEWNHSVDYLPDIFNSNSGKFKDSFAPQFPEVQMATNSFNFNGCNISLISFSNNSEKNVASEELMTFSNSFIEFIEKNKTT